MKILLIATRTPSGELHGRKMVLRTIVKSLQSLNHSVKVISFDTDDIPIFDDQYIDVHLEFPGFFEIIRNITFKFLTGSMSLNECLFYKIKNKKTICSYVDKYKPNIVITDMLRTAPYVEGLEDVKWIADLDDLLSKRYLNLARNVKDSDVLGNFSTRYNPFVGKLFNYISKPIYLIESKVVKKREIEIARKADATVLVSEIEANILSKKVGKKVFAIPMGFKIVEIDKINNEGKTGALVFLGSMKYQPNQEAIKFYCSEINRNGELAELYVVGNSEGFEGSVDKSCNIKFSGYVDDIKKELIRHSIFIAPILSGTGIKTKVLDAMFIGLPIIGTSKAFEGLSVQHKVHCWIADDPTEFSLGIKKLFKDIKLREKIGENGRRYAESEFTESEMIKRWGNLIQYIEHKIE